MRPLPGANVPLQSSASVRSSAGRANRADVFGAALRNTMPRAAVVQAVAEGSTRLSGPDKQAVRGYARPDGKVVPDYLRRKPRWPMKSDPTPEA